MVYSSPASESYPQEPRPDLEAQLNPAEQATLHRFYSFASDTLDLDPRTAEVREEVTIAYAAHNFLHAQAEAEIHMNQQLGQNARPLYLVPKDPIRRRITDAYREFKPGRSGRTGQLHEREEQWVAERMRPLFANVYLSPNSPGAESGNAKEPRYESFPEIKAGISLWSSLRFLRQDVAADGVETVLAAYGARILNIAGHAGRMANEARRPQYGSMTTYVINPQDIPEDMRAEQWNGPRGRRAS